MDAIRVSGRDLSMCMVWLSPAGGDGLEMVSDGEVLYLEEE